MTVTKLQHYLYLSEKFRQTLIEVSSRLLPDVRSGDFQNQMGRHSESNITVCIVPA